MSRKRRRTGKIIEKVFVESLGYGGVGIASLEDGKKLLIKGALPESVVDVKIVKKRRDYAMAHIVNVHSIDPKWMDAEVKCPHYYYYYRCEDSPSPQTPPNPLSPLPKGEGIRGEPHYQVSKIGCGGCKRQGMSYERQLELKYSILENCFAPLKKHVGDMEILPVIASPSPWQYRNKIEFSFGKYLKRYTSPPSDKKSELPLVASPGVDMDKTFSKEQQREWGFEIAEHRQCGFHKQGEFSKIVDIDQCYLISEKMHRVYAYIKQSLQKSGLPVYDAMSHQGLLRHLVIREGVRTGHIMVNLAIAPQHFLTHAKEKTTWEKLLTTWKKDPFLQENITTLVVTENDGVADTVRGQDIRLSTIRGEGRIFELLKMRINESNSVHQISSDPSSDFISIRFQISPFSFFQTNTAGAELLFSVGAQMLGEVKGNLIDLYCGSGTIGLSFLKLGIGQKLVGIDIVASAIQDAKHNAKINGLSEKSEFLCGKVEKILGVDSSSPEVKPRGEKTLTPTPLPTASLGEGLIGGDAVVIDPPREGLHPQVVAFLIALRKQKKYKLLYISCNPTTMARDLALLVEGGFSFSAIQPVDMFPQTHHVECVTLLQ